mmetsp:Transcript_115303/g.224125  ORF Transcript_115303/g.224125 Transcript_115303/m.224125 type:complete len:171 (-) Transcript_115303:110-622(-)|eukprot:CAMPEP_0172657838 /NCGR_PEP_ID=MMETSP1074-20121228/2375_1 /TAXON_ID=2916 /ORGANISM="Ceratium fusus, Strain PA161109" /LENGTH=170 /DNA_ID=CAMNT_0013473027 /DNA_START=77 /DNA_END=589 /DNA_ORIENTATION=+
MALKVACHAQQDSPSSPGEVSVLSDPIPAELIPSFEVLWNNCVTVVREGPKIEGEVVGFTVTDDSENSVRCETSFKKAGTSETFMIINNYKFDKEAHKIAMEFIGSSDVIDTYNFVFHEDPLRVEFYALGEGTQLPEALRGQRRAGQNLQVFLETQLAEIAARLCPPEQS